MSSLSSNFATQQGCPSQEEADCSWCRPGRKAVVLCLNPQSSQSLTQSQPEKKKLCCFISCCPPIPLIPCAFLRRQKCDHASNSGSASAWKQETAAQFPTVLSVSCKIIRFHNIPSDMGRLRL